MSLNRFVLSPDQKLAGLPATNPALLIKFVQNFKQLGITVKEHFFSVVLWSGVAPYTITTRQMMQIKGPGLSLNGPFAAVAVVPI